MDDRGEAFLKIDKLEVSYGGIKALHGVDLCVKQREIVAVIGANGAGKSTLMKAIAGIKERDSGSILLEGKPLPTQSHRAVLRGVALVPEGRRIFAPLSVRDNLMLGAYTRKDRASVAATLDRMFSLFPVLRERQHQTGGTLSGGEQQMLAVARALMSEPSFLLLDEPSLGLAPLVVDKLFDAILALNEETGLAILVVEQNAAMALDICDRAYVLETGSIRLEGTGEQLRNDPRVRDSYLGSRA